MIKTQRIGVYGLCMYNGKIVVIKKKRGPFTGKLDLPGGKIEHSEFHIDGLKRELNEELGLDENDYEIQKIFSVEEDFIKHTWKDEEKDEHIIAIVYQVEIFNLDEDFIENGGDSEKILLINKNDKTFAKTNILHKILSK